MCKKLFKKWKKMRQMSKAVDLYGDVLDGMEWEKSGWRTVEITQAEIDQMNKELYGSEDVEILGPVKEL